MRRQLRVIALYLSGARGFPWLSSHSFEDFMKRNNDSPNATNETGGEICPNCHVFLQPKCVSGTQLDGTEMDADWLECSICGFTL